MAFRFFQRRNLWWPTWAGWLLFGVLLGTPVLFWIVGGEAWLSRTERLPATVLVVEGWTGIEAITSAKAEYDRGGYEYVITSGNLAQDRWDPAPINHATAARELLLQLGLPSDRVIAAPAEVATRNRTFSTALAVRLALESRGLRPKAVNVFTIGVHARRSRLVYAKVLPADTAVGVIACFPGNLPAGPWWRSSERAAFLWKETAGWLYEALFNSGRLSNSPPSKSS